MKQADIIIKSNHIFDGIKDLPFKGYIAVGGNKIMNVGTDQDCEKYISEKTKVLECGDKMVMPGFIDAHMHYFCGVFQSSEYMCRDLFESKSEADCVEIIKEFGRRHPDYKKISGMGWFPLLWDDKDAMPSKDSLDQIEPDRPVYLLAADGHTFWLNSKALEQCGITAETKVSFGKIGKDEHGELNGLLFEIEAEERANALAFQLPEHRAEEMIQNFNRELLQYGITSVTDMSVNPEPVGDFSEYKAAANLEAGNQLKVRLNLYPSLGITPDTATAERLRSLYHSDKLRVAGLKQFIDGVSSTYSAYLLEPYSDRAGFTASPCYPYKIYEDCITNANRNGFGVRLHAIGDGAIRLGLDAIESARKKTHSDSVRNSLEHLEAIDPADIARFGKLDVTCSMQPQHIPPTAYEKEVRLGNERCKYQWPFKSLLKAGAKLAFGTDFPVAPVSPMRTVYDAAARVDEKGEEIKINLWERISVAEALKAYTAGSAYSIGMEDKLGTLERGKLADLIILDQNVFDIDLSQIPQVKVELTMMDGEIVYNR